jgi:transcriptional regulator with XRE-family HTH domain
MTWPVIAVTAAAWRPGNCEGIVLGERIRTVRLERNLSVRGLAAEAGVSPALVSQVERGINDPSLDTLRRLAQALGTPLFDLFQDPVDTKVAVVRAAERTVISAPHGGISYSRVSPAFGKLEVLEGVLGPQAASSEQPWQHPSEECVIVTSGQLVVEVAGDRHQLFTGDSCYFDSRQPHRYVNESAAGTLFLLSITPPSY